MSLSSRTAGLLLVALAACQPGTAPHPASPALGFKISGTVTGGGSVTAVQASGPVAASVAPDAAGHFTLSGLPRGVYTLTVQAARTVAFTPASRQVEVFDRDVAGQDFAASAVAVLEGTVGGAGAAGATITLAGPVARAVTTAASGYYRIDGLPSGTYAVAAGGAGFGFTPVSRLVTLAAGAVTTADFASAAQAGNHAIAGSVVGGAPAGVKVTLAGAASGETLTDAGGHYRFAGLGDGGYQVLVDPVAGYLWQARWRPATLAGADVTGLDFTELVPKTARFAYVVAQAIGGSGFVVNQYAIDAAGALTPLSPATVDVATSPGPAVADPGGRWLYLAAGSILQYAIGADGTLGPLTPAAATGPTQPRLLAMDPKGRWLWAHDASTTSLWRFSIGTDGTLSSPASTVVGGAVDLVVHPSGDSLYVVSRDAVAHYLVGGDGTLTAATPASVGVPAGDATGSNMAKLTFDAAGQYAYVTAANSTAVAAYAGWLLTFAVDASGTLTSAGAPVHALYYSQISFGPQEVVVEPSGRFAWVAPDGTAWWAASDVASFAVGLDGLPSSLSASFSLGQTCPAYLVPDPSGRRLYAASGVVQPAYASGSNVAWFDIAADGSLSKAGSLPLGLSAQSLTIVSQ